MWKWIPVCLIVGCAAEVRSESPTRKPTSLDDCYLEIVRTKTDADAAFVARELCDAVFAEKRRSLFLHAKGGPCVEWWLDKRGRYENHDVMCAFEPAGGANKWTLACQYKDKASRVTLVELSEDGDRYRRAGDVIGVDPGEIFKTMAACIRHKGVR